MSLPLYVRSQKPVEQGVVASLRNVVVWRSVVTSLNRHAGIADSQLQREQKNRRKLHLTALAGNHYTRIPEIKRMLAGTVSSFLCI